MNYIREAENRLRYYRDLQGSIDEMHRRIGRLVGKAGPSSLTAINLDETGIKSGHYDETINIIHEIQTLQKSIERTKDEIDEIHQILNEISQEPKCELYGMVLRKWYIEHVPKERIAHDLQYSSIQTVYSIKNKAIRKFAVRLFGIDSLNVV